MAAVRVFALTGLILSALLAAASCATPSRSTTRFTNDDFSEIGTQIADKLRSSDLLRDRSPESPPLTVTVTAPVNYTSDIMTEGERWYVMDRVVDSLSLRTLSREKNISFVLSVQQLEESRAKPDVETPAGRRPPTHTLNATFRSTTYSVSDARTDAYYCQYEIADLADGRVVWSDRFEFKRAATGKSYN